MSYRNRVLFSLCARAYLSLLVIDLTLSKDPVLDVHAVRYTCSECWLPTSPYALPLIRKTRSRLECSAACSRREWCSRYATRKDTSYTGGSSNPTPYECYLNILESSPCLANTPSTFGTTSCVKVTNGSKDISDVCSVAPLTVLETKGIEASLKTDFVYIRNLLAAGNELVIQYDIGTVKYAAVSSYVTLGNGSSEVCATVVDCDEPSNNTAALLFLREFCTGSLPQTPIPTTWKVQRKKYINKGGDDVVFNTGGNTSYLEAALNNGSEIKLMIKGNNSVLRAEIISQNEDKRYQIAAQTTLFENGNYKILSYHTSHQENTVLLDLSLGNLKKPRNQKADVLWLSDSCWRHVHTTHPPSQSKGPSLNILLNSINEGRRIRVKFKIDKLIVLATPDLVGLDRHKTVIAHVLRVLSQEPFLGKLVKLPSLSNPSHWAHYYITSDGNINLIHKSQMIPVTDAALIDWFVEVQNYTLAYTSSSRNVTGLARLVTPALEDKRVRVRVHNGTNRIFYSCDMVQVIHNGQEVKCQVNGQLGVELLGRKISKSIDLSSILPPNLSALVGLTTATGCFQSVVLLAYQGCIDYFLSCPGPSNSSQIRITQSQEVDWFVAD